MIGNYYTLAHLAERFDSELTSRRILSVFTQERGRLTVQIEDAPFLIISCHPRLNTLFLDHRFTRARKNTLDLFTACHGNVIRHVSIDPGDRIINFRLDSGDLLQARFFGPRANVFHMHGNGDVVGSFRKKGYTAETVRPASQRQPDNLLTIVSDESAGSVLKSFFPLLGSLLVKEALSRASVPPSTGWNALGEDAIALIVRSLEEIHQDLRNVRPVVYTTERGRSFSLIPLRQFGDAQVEDYDDINDALRSVVAGEKPRRAKESPKALLSKQIEALLAKAERAEVAIMNDLDGASRAMDYERFGKLLLSALHAVPQGAAEAELADEQGTVSVPLEPALSANANAQRYFDKAKRSRTARRENERRLADLQERTVLLRSLQRDLMTLESDREFSGFQSEHAAALETLGLTVQQQAALQRPFRTFHVDGGFEVWAGKNSKSNDELTMKYAKPNDIWFHARGAGGSHVVLRTNSAAGDPTKNAKLQAAAIAAHYSKLKGAGLVPVAMTRRKYVRKPKGSPPGTVLIEREEVLLVRPGLPANSQ